MDTFYWQDLFKVGQGTKKGVWRVSLASHNLQQSLPPRSFQTQINKEKEKSVKHVLKNLRVIVMYVIISNIYGKCLLDTKRFASII